MAKLIHEIKVVVPYTDNPGAGWQARIEATKKLGEHLLFEPDHAFTEDLTLKKKEGLLDNDEGVRCAYCSIKIYRP